MAPSKFGATKFRNAVATVPYRDGWYRTGLSTLASDAPSNTSAFSSVLKSSREGIVSLTPGGDASIRYYNALGEKEAEVWTGKLGGAVLDWDLSRLEDGGLLVAGSDNTVSYYMVDGVAAPTKLHSFAVTSKISNVSLHPTTPGVALVTSINPVVTVYDVAASTPAFTLTTPGSVALWSAAWSSDGRLVGGVGKKGQAYIWDARAGADPVQSKDVAMQPLKPARVAFVHGDLFVTSFSRTRSRQYSLLSAATGLSATFTASVDNNQGPLAPLVDEERGIVYAVGRGDMTLRQIELSGPMGYQESPHALPAQVSSSSLAASHWSTLAVMEAQVATILLPTSDKDGVAILPLATKVPRRQLIDYHADLFPEVSSSVPEQTVGNWVKGEDRAPLPVSIDPGRRGEWETTVAEGKKAYANGAAAPAAPAAAQPAAEPAAAPAAAPAPTSERPTPTSSAPAPAPPPAAAATPPVTVTIPSPTSPMAAAKAAASASTQIQVESPARSGTAPPVVLSMPPPPSLPASVTSGLPPLQPGESHASTSYKVRFIGDRILRYQKDHVAKGNKGPLMVGLQGPQGCGKTTLSEAFLEWLENEGLSVAVLSLDDLYRTHAGLKKLAADHPNNSLLAGRGPPGTHDVELATTILDAIKNINNGNGHVDLPVFDKSLCNGEGDRSAKTVPVDGPLDVFILEGWSFGFHDISPAELESRYAKKDGKYFPQQPLSSLAELNSYLTDVVSKVYPYFNVLVQVEPKSYEYVFAWRLQQEHAMKLANGGRGMSDDEVHKFVERYMPAYELWAEGVLNDTQPWAGRLVRLRYGEDREVVALETPEPRKVAPVDAKRTESPSLSQPAVAAGAAPAAKVPQPTPVQTAPAPAPVHRSPATPISPSQSPKLTPTAAPAPGATPATTSAAAPAAATTSSASYNPNWSRKYVAGKSPLNPTYDQVPAVLTLHQDSIVLRVTPHLALFPIQGPGGRICVHPLSTKGRVPVGGIGYLSGGVGLADFVADQFSDNVVLAGEDGVLRVWRVGQEGIEGAGPEPDKTMRGNHIDKIAQIAFHPTAKDLLVAATNDLGKASLRFFDITSATEAKQVVLDVKGITGFAIAPAGDRIAVATKDSKVAVLNPRDPSTLVTGKAHDSPRACQLAWVDKTHILSIGFGRGSMRKINLYAIGDNEITTESSLTIDVSPGVLFPVYDPDTNILYVWGKGERAIQAYEVHPGKPEAIAKLSAFTGSNPQLAIAFFPKPTVDVRKVEVARCLRLTSRSIEEVSFSIPRNKPAFFQNVIYVPTVQVAPTTTAEKWLAGDNTPPVYIDLQPADMTLLSEAPVTTTAARTKFVPAADVMSEEEKKRREMDALFQKAKADLSSDEEDEPPRGGIPPPDDDW